MGATARHLACSSFDDDIVPYCFDDLSEAARERFELHLLSCGTCWSEVQRLTGAVQVLRMSPKVTHRARTNEIVGLLGMSGQLARPFAGHGIYASLASTLYALLFAIPVLVEIAYAYDRHRALAIPLALTAFLSMTAATAATFWVAAQSVKRGEGNLGRLLMIQFGATATLALLVVRLLPSEQTVLATFGTWPANLGYLKSVFYAWMIGPLFLFLPFHFVVNAQRELAGGRHSTLLALLTESKVGVPPRGTPYLRVWALGLYLAAIVTMNYIGVNNLFSNLLPGPYKEVFMSLVLLRVTVWIGLAAGALWWYSACLTELKREALALRALASP